jgi:hypothetical protein
MGRNGLELSAIGECAHGAKGAQVVSEEVKYISPIFFTYIVCFLGAVGGAIYLAVHGYLLLAFMLLLIAGGMGMRSRDDDDDE